MTVPFYPYRQFMINRYGAPLFRVPIDPGLGCPNRQADGTGGCTFCAEDGGRAVQLRDAQTIRDQVAQSIRFARRRYHAERFMAYVQAYTGTFAAASDQRELLVSVFEEFPFDALSIGTRPDCVLSETCDLLTEVNRSVETWVELGVQTTHDHTLARIQRGHDWACSRDAILRLHEKGLRVVAHVILGLPGETEADMMRTAERLSALPLEGIKIHNLHIIRGTRLEEEFRAGAVSTCDESDYAELLIEFLRRLPPSLPIMRLCTDTPADLLVAPRWFMSKGAFREFIQRQMVTGGWTQGDLL